MPLCSMCMYACVCYTVIPENLYFLAISSSSNASQRCRSDCSGHNITSPAEQSNRTSGHQPLCDQSVEQRVGIYGGLLVTLIVVNITRLITLFFVCVNSSRVLHNRMFASILRAPVLFFDTNPVGRVLNRFSNDTGALDDLLPLYLSEYMMVSANLYFKVIIIPHLWDVPSVSAI